MTKPDPVESQSNNPPLFDDLVDAVKSLFINTRAVLDQHHARSLEQYFTNDDAGHRTPILVSIKEPLRSGDDAASKMIQVPLGGLMSGPVLNLTELIIEFDCVIKEQTLLFRSADKPLVMNLKNWQSRQREGIDKVRIEYRLKGKAFEGAAYVNGEMFRTLCGPAKKAESETATPSDFSDVQ